MSHIENELEKLRGDMRKTEESIKSETDDSMTMNGDNNGSRKVAVHH